MHTVMRQLPPYAALERIEGEIQMSNVRKAAEAIVPLLDKLAEEVNPEVMDWDDAKKIQVLKTALSTPDESDWQFKIVGFRTVTLPNGKEEIQFSIADADAPKGWS